jgi:hypothetical protein
VRVSGAVAAAALVVPVVAAAADDPTPQTAAADGMFLRYAAPPTAPGVVCLVDSGVDANPDTTALLAGAEASDSSWGTGDALAQDEPLVNGHPVGHGTEMAMLIAAPANGWGIVGIAPTATRVYSIRVVAPQQTTFPSAGYATAIDRCVQLHGTTEPAMTVINLSLESSTPTPADLPFLEASIDTAREHGLDVVAAAGNDAANSVSYPAAYPPVVAVGAGDAATGALCTFSNRNGLDIIAPGCDSATGGVGEAFGDDGSPAVGNGTSQATAIVSGVLAALRAYNPLLSPTRAEACLTGGETPGGSLDAAATFNACGLDAVVQQGEASEPIAPPPPVAPDAAPAAGATGPPGATGPGAAEPTPGPSRTAAPRRLAAVHLGVPRRSGGTLRVTAAARPPGESLQFRVLARPHREPQILATRTVKSTHVTFRVGGAYKVEARALLTSVSGTRASSWTSRLIP